MIAHIALIRSRLILTCFHSPDCLLFVDLLIFVHYLNFRVVWYHLHCHYLIDNTKGIHCFITKTLDGLSNAPYTRLLYNCRSWNLCSVGG
jgi:hypothetical protein